MQQEPLLQEVPLDVIGRIFELAAEGILGDPLAPRTHLANLRLACSVGRSATHAAFMRHILTGSPPCVMRHNLNRIRRMCMAEFGVHEKHPFMMSTQMTCDALTDYEVAKFDCIFADIDALLSTYAEDSWLRACDDVGAPDPKRKENNTVIRISSPDIVPLFVDLGFTRNRNHIMASVGRRRIHPHRGNPMPSSAGRFTCRFSFGPMHSRTTSADDRSVRRRQRRQWLTSADFLAHKNAALIEMSLETSAAELVSCVILVPRSGDVDALCRPRASVGHALMRHVLGSACIRSLCTATCDFESSN